jgi:hypothetical protein
MNRIFRLAAVTAVFAACFLLAACGADSGLMHAAKAQGLYKGTNGAGDSLFEVLITPDDRVFGLYGISVANTVSDVITGTITESGTQFNGTVLDTYQSGTSGAVTLSGSFAQGSSITGTLDEQVLSRDFTASTPDTTAYQYDMPATVANVADTWTGFVILENGIATTVVDSSGSLTGTMNFGCTYSGSVKPDQSGKNFFDVTLSLGATCNRAGAKFSGVAVVMGKGQTKALIAIANDSSNTKNILLLGSNAPPAATN